MSRCPACAAHGDHKPVQAFSAQQAAAEGALALLPVPSRLEA